MVFTLGGIVVFVIVVVVIVWLVRRA